MCHGAFLPEAALLFCRTGGPWIQPFSLVSRDGSNSTTLVTHSLERPFKMHGFGRAHILRRFANHLFPPIILLLLLHERLRCGIARSKRRTPPGRSEVGETIGA
ncbi:unnamed protein product [Scytosiphon promiscuus]